MRLLWLLPTLVLLLAGLGRRLGYRLPVTLGVVTIIGIAVALSAAHWPLEVAPYVHRLLLIAVLAHVGLFLWNALCGQQDRRAWRLPEEVGPAALLVMGLMQPAFDTLAYGQTDILVLLLLVLVLLGLRNGWSRLAGASLALGIIVKLYLLLWVGFLILRRRWAILAWTAVAFGLLNGLAIAVMGWNNHLVFVREVLPILGGGTNWVENQTINGFVSRLLTDTLRTDPIRDPLINLLTYAAFGIVAGLPMLLAFVPIESRSSAFMLQFSNLAVVMPLAIPAAWMHYETSTILPFIALIWLSADHPLPLRRAFWVACAFGLIAFGNQAYGMLVLWLVTVTTLAQTLDAKGFVRHLRSYPGARRLHAAPVNPGVSYEQV